MEQLSLKLEVQLPWWLHLYLFALNVAFWAGWNVDCDKAAKTIGRNVRFRLGDGDWRKLD